jgi:S1-C subfamily serine protease
MEHPSPRCVVELRTIRADGSAGLGSGYLVAEGWVLTAAHVVGGASSVRAWVNPQATLTVQEESPVETAGIVRFPGAIGRWCQCRPIGRRPGSRRSSSAA